MFARIFVPINLNDASSWSRALPVAVTLAQASETHLKLGTILPHWVSTRDADWSWDAARRLEEVAFQRLRSIAKQCGCEDFSLEARWGSVPSTIADMAVDADLVVMAARKPSFMDFFRTPAGLKVAAAARCSVMMVRDR
jgi:Universal stress protein UspA and related nucleotide-binding proteins